MTRNPLLVLGMLALVALSLGLAPPPAASVSPPPAELTSKTWLYEVVRHAYRWYIDERDIDAVVKADEIIFKVRELKPKLDEGDNSRFGEVLLPQFSLRIKVKLADYSISELNAIVKTDTFKIVGISQLDAADITAEGFTEVRANYTEMREHLFKTRALASCPEGELFDRMRVAIRAELIKDYAERKQPVPQGLQTVYLASLSPVANEAWVFWETGKILIRFASDIDLANPSVWTHEKLAVKVYHLDQNVVVSLDEVSGSNAFMTRNQAGRGLFNCVIGGKKLEFMPVEPVTSPK